jgi:hypothetical protein
MLNKYSFDKIEDSVYSDTARALVMAWHSKDENLIEDIISSAVAPLMAAEGGAEKMLMAMLLFSHSVTFTLATMSGIAFEEIMVNDAAADYKVQQMMMDGDIEP